MIETHVIEPGKLEKIIDDKITMLELNACGLLDFIENSTYNNESSLVRETIDYLGETLNNLSINYIFKASHCLDDNDIFLNYISKAVIINPNLKIKEVYNFMNPSIGISLKGNEGENVSALVSSALTIQLPKYKIYNETADLLKTIYNVNPELVMAKIEVGELKEEIVNEFGYKGI